MNIVQKFYSDYKASRAFKSDAKAFVGGSIGFMDLFAAGAGYGGDKFHTGFGITKDYRVVHLKKLQFRSIQLVRENLTANAILTRLGTKVINKGLNLNSAPIYEILNPALNLSDEELRKWSRTVEAKFLAWSREKNLVSWNKEYDFAASQQMAYNTAHISGDCLVIITIASNGLPVVKLVDGFYVSNPLQGENKNRVIHGVELDSKNKEVAYYVEDGCGGHVRVSAFARGSKRRRAWLVKNTQQRIDDIRGMPLFGLIMQNVNAAEQYMGAEQRAAYINSNLAMTRTRADTQGAAAAGSRRRGILGSKTVETSAGNSVTFEQTTPGLFLSNLAPGETINSFDTKRPNINFGPFMDSVIKPCAYANEIPPEKLFMEYGNNFSASRMADMDFMDAVSRKTHNFSRSYNDPIYNEVLTGLILRGSVVAPGYVQSLIDPELYEIKNAWQNTAWRGLPLSSVDIKKLVQALEIIEEKAWLNNEQIARDFFGSDFFDNVRRLKTEVDSRVVARSSETKAENTDYTTGAEATKSKILTMESSITDIKAVIDDVVEKIDDIKNDSEDN